MIAGPSEILVLADGGCNPAWVAADLLSQAEHDKLASPVLVTDSPELAKAVQAELEVQIPQLPRAAIARPLRPAISLHRNIWKCAWRIPSAC